MFSGKPVLPLPSTGGWKMALRRWPSGSLRFSEETSKSQCQEEKKQLEQKSVQDKGLRAGEGLGLADRRGELQDPPPAVRWAPPTAALSTGSVSKTHILNTCFPAHAGNLEGAGKFRRWGPAEEVDHRDPGPSSLFPVHHKPLPLTCAPTSETYRTIRQTNP